jgi:hypothetical protein
LVELEADAQRLDTASAAWLSFHRVGCCSTGDGMAHESIFAEWKKSAFGSFLNISEYWKQRALILRQPSLLFEDPALQLTIRPLAFALRGLLLLTVVFSLATWALKTFAELPPTPLDRAIAESKNFEQQIARKQADLKDLVTAANMAQSGELIELKKIQDLSETLRVLLLPIAFTLTAYLFRRRFVKYARTAAKVNDADRAYLYWVTARLFWPNIVFVVGTQVLELAARFNAGESYLPLVLGIWLLWICGIWSLFVLRRAAPVLSRILELDKVLGAQKALSQTANNLVISAVLTNVATFIVMSAILHGYSALVVRSAG